MATIQHVGTEKFIGWVLRCGVLLCGAVLATAVFLFIAGSQHADPVALLGVKLLVALPIIRVALTVVLFALQRDRVYFVITSVVFLILLSSLFFERAI